MDHRKGRNICKLVTSSKCMVVKRKKNPLKLRTRIEGLDISYDHEKSLIFKSSNRVHGLKCGLVFVTNAVAFETDKHTGYVNY